METGVLEELGLSHAEAKVYLALLEVGSSKTGPVIHSTRLQSSTVYHVLGSLAEKGLVSYIFKGKIKYYQAENPESFLVFLEDKKRKFSEILPLLKQKEVSSKQKQTAKVYEGFNGLKAAYNDILTNMKAGEEYYFFQLPKENLFNKQVILFFRNYHLKRAAKGIRVRALALRETKKIMKAIFKGIRLTKIRYLDEFTPTGVVIYKNKFITFDFERIPTAFVIQSDVVANSYKKFFEEKWKKARG